MLVSLVLGLGLEHSCPWPREGLFSERLSLALDFFVSLALASSLVSSTPPLAMRLSNNEKMQRDKPLFSQRSAPQAPRFLAHSDCVY